MKETSFDIRKLDRIAAREEVDYEAFEEYANTLADLFFDSPEGTALLETTAGIGFWTVNLLEYGFNHLGVTLPRMKVADVGEILMGIFPRKISLDSPEEAEETVPELVAFWEFLKRQYQLPNADSVLDYLKGAGPEFKRRMNDPANFGMAKRFFTMGQSAGFDMTKQEDMNKFMALYNSPLMEAAREPQERRLPPTLRGFFPSGETGPADPHRKIKRKAASAARKKNRKKRK